MSARPNSAGPRVRTSRAILVLVVLAAIIGLGVRMCGGGSPKQPVTTAQDVAARFASLHGNVKLRPVGGLEWSSAEMSTPLRKNDLLRTYQASTAEIVFVDDTRVSVRPDSLITIEQSSQDATANSTSVKWKIDEGEFEYKAGQRGNGTAEAVTPTFRLALDRSSEGSVRVGTDKRATIAQRAGSVTVSTTAGETAKLAANEGVVVDSAGRIGAKQQLPVLPPISPLGSGGVLDLADGAPIPLTWPAAAGAASYRVVLEESKQGATAIVLDRKGIADTKLAVPGIEGGDFAFRVAPETAEGIEGAFSPRVAFKVQRKPKAVPTPAPSIAAAATPAPAAALHIEVFEIRGNVVRLVGRSTPGSRITVNGFSIPVQPDGSFREFVTLSLKLGDQVVVRATDASGGVAEETRTAQPR